MLSDAFKPGPVVDEAGNVVEGLIQIQSQKVNKVSCIDGHSPGGFDNLLDRSLGLEMCPDAMFSYAERDLISHVCFDVSSRIRALRSTSVVVMSLEAAMGMWTTMLRLLTMSSTRLSDSIFTKSQWARRMSRSTCKTTARTFAKNSRTTPTFRDRKSKPLPSRLPSFASGFFKITMRCNFTRRVSPRIAHSLLVFPDGSRSLTVD